MKKDQIRKGRLAGERSRQVLRYLSSMEADRWIGEADILVDMAHVVMLHRQKLMAPEHARALLRVLLQLHGEGLPDTVFDEQFEDIHAGLEAYLMERAGEDVGGRIHMGRSRNDEVATCLRIRLREDLLRSMDSLVRLREVLFTLAEAHRDAVMPGFTHLQPAQPTTLPHHLLAYEQALGRDFDRLRAAFLHVNLSPLGAAAFASTGYPVDREMTARLLGFDQVLGNSMDAVASRDFVLETLAAGAILMTLLSRMAEDLILWSTPAFGFVSLDDAYCSSSSIMPQKKNPDTLEILRAKAGTAQGALSGALTIVKGLPMSYNRDLQEVTPHLWRGMSAVMESTDLLARLLQGATFDEKRMAQEAARGFSTATDLADMLVRSHNLPFRTAHTIVGRAVRRGSLDLRVLEAAAQEVAGISLVQRGVTADEVAVALDVPTAIASRSAAGGPAPEAITRALRERRRVHRQDSAWVVSQEKAIQEALSQLLADARELVA
jgi:argininosuccinate lyase